MDEDLSSDSGEESDNISSCSSMADSDYSIPESYGKGSSTTTTSDFPSGNTSENENPTSLCGESPACDSTENLVSTKTRFELHKQQNEPTQKNTTNNEQSVDAETDKQDASLSKEASTDNASTTSKGGIRKQDTQSSQSIASENIAKSQDNGCKGGETCSSDSASSVIDTERKCEDSVKEKDESSSGQCGSVQNAPLSNSVSLKLSGHSKYGIANRLSY